MGLNEQYFERWAEREAQKRASVGWSNLPWIHFFFFSFSSWWWNWGTKAFTFQRPPKCAQNIIYFFAKVFSLLFFFDYPLRSRIFSFSLHIWTSFKRFLLPQTSHTYLTLDSILTNDFFLPKKHLIYSRSQEVMPTGILRWKMFTFSPLLP